MTPLRCAGSTRSELLRDGGVSRLVLVQGRSLLALSERVGEDGYVVVVDRDPRFLGEFVELGREVLAHDITAGPVPPSDFDFAHCRAVLAHVADLSGAAVGGTLRAQYRIHSMQHVQSRIIDSGFCSESAFARMLELFEDPSFEYIDNSWIATWGRTPE